MLWEWIDVFKEFCKPSMKEARSMKHVIIAIISQNHPGTEGALVLYMQGSKGIRLANRGRKGFHSVAAPSEPQYFFQIVLDMGLVQFFVLCQLGEL